MSNTAIIQIGPLYFKREDKNPTGSVKDRALPLQIKNLINTGYQSAVISSTGNAAISAQYYCQKNNIPLTIFVSKKINPQKLKLLKNIKKSNKPISDAVKFSKTNHSYLLRQSTDPSALLGYQNLGQEIIQQMPQVTSIYFPVGSGTTLLGVSQAIADTIKIFAVQPASNPTLSKFFTNSYTHEDNTITDALSVKTLPLKDQLITTIKKHHGSGLIVSNQQAITAQKNLHQQLQVSPETALTYAAYLQNPSIAGDFPLIIVTGQSR